MATEILINDGGAPSRILPFIASEDISAGEVLKAGTTGGECSLATVTTAPVLEYRTLSLFTVSSSVMEAAIKPSLSSDSK